MPRSASIGPEKAFICPICKKRFTSKYIRDSHVLVVHENSGRFKCGHCDKTFQQKAMMERHERTHTGEKPFSCRICKMRFVEKYTLKNHHLRKHSDKKFKCPTCDKAFGRENTLKQHLIVHLEEKPFQCEECQKRFARKQELKKHHLDHHTEKKFECPTCGKAFGREAILKLHLVVHSDDRPFGCDQCTASFKHKHSLKQHQAIHSRTQRKSSGARSLVQSTARKELIVKVEQPDGGQGSGSRQYGLRMRRRSTNYGAGQGDEESGENSESSSTEDDESSGEDREDESSESDEESGRDDETVGQEDALNEMPAKRLKTENRVPDEKVPALDDPVVASQMSVKREPDSDDQAGDDRPTIILSSDESDQNDDLPPKSSTVTNPKLKLVFDVEYKPPVQTEATEFDCYDFNDLVRKNQRRMKEESSETGAIPSRPSEENRSS